MAEHLTAEQEVTFLRKRAIRARDAGHAMRAIELELASDLLELHDQQALSMDEWASARIFIEVRIGHPLKPNGV